MMIENRFNRQGAQQRLDAQKRRVQTDLSLVADEIFDFFIESVRSLEPAIVLQHFKALFIYNTAEDVPCSLAVQEILLNNSQTLFFQTLKRTCYILVNNWDSSRQGPAICELIESFQDPRLKRHSLDTMTQRLRAWVQAFVESQDFSDLSFFAERFQQRKATSIDEKIKTWSDRYSHYQLIHQAEHENSSPEQREATRGLIQKMRHRFRLDLAFYVAHHQSPKHFASSTPQVSAIPGQGEPENPTGLGDTTLNLIKTLVMRKGFFSPENLARIFLEQVKGTYYFEYKESLLNYFSYQLQSDKVADKKTIISQLRSKLQERFDQLYVDRDMEIVSPELMLRTCNQVINFLTIESQNTPSTIFTLFVSQEHYLLLAMTFLKVMLISPASRRHLDLQIARLVSFYQQAYEDHEPEESDWFGHFLDVMNVTLAVYAEGVNYKLIQANPVVQSYHIFSQVRPREQSQDD